MLGFVGIPPFLRIALRLAMATVHLHIAQTDLFFRHIFLCINGVQGSNLAPMKNCPVGETLSNEMPG